MVVSLCIYVICTICSQKQPSQDADIYHNPPDPSLPAAEPQCNIPGLQQVCCYTCTTVKIMKTPHVHPLVLITAPLTVYRAYFPRQYAKKPRDFLSNMRNP